MNFLTQKKLSRRHLLRGAGASLGLPFLEAMMPSRISANSPVTPQRLAFFYIPNGVVQDTWHPEKTGANFEITPSLEPLKNLRQDISLFTGLDREFRGGTSSRWYSLFTRTTRGRSS